ncbi:MAG: NAD(+)/NADH kinase, partial [Mucilaginibacter polytrichastri]|nr:NAD(+)/NADH kinase [Mucilaginibacter polytrichastri]
MMRLLVVKNPGSGRVTAEDTIGNILREKQEQYNWEVQICLVSDKDFVQVVNNCIDDFKPDVLVAIGGDGTVNFVAEICLQKKLPFAIIPAGSANGMAHELLIPNDPRFAFDLIEKGKQLTIDLLRINGHICIHLADVGVNARIVKSFQKDKRRGILTYAKYLFNELFLTKKYRFYIDYDNEHCVHKGVSLTFANSSKYGTGAIINPVGKIDDGKFELCIMRPFPKFRLPGIAWKLFRG